MPQGLLNGFALPAQVWPAADHTYVTSSHGHAWGCYGRSAGGILICSGLGNTDVADCLAQPNCEAGINYGINGLCHQMSNRILLPAQQFVSQAAYYRYSFSLFGAYGATRPGGRRYSPTQNPWAELYNCRANHQHP
jgi:hypothetical protein